MQILSFILGAWELTLLLGFVLVPYVIYRIIKRLFFTKPPTP